MSEASTELLDNAIWNALTTEQSSFAERVGDAARFDPAVTSLAGLRAPTSEAFADLARLLGGEARAGVFLDHDVAIPSGLVVDDSAELVQMIQPIAAPYEDDEAIVLSARDADPMLELAMLTRPGPFGPRTSQLGTFLGIRDAERLVAMAGRRMRLHGLVEVSAVCTHPDHLGRGLAARLMRAQAARIHAEGALPFLHVRADNARAIALYARLGFVERRRSSYWVVRSGG